MPQPTYTDVHVDAALSNMSVAYIQNAAHFVAAQVFPVVPVSFRSDSYFVYDKQAWRRNQSGVRAPGTESKGSGFGITTATYTCAIHAFHKDVDDPTRANADAAINVDRDATEFVTQQLLIEREVIWGANHFTTGKWATDRTGGTHFTKWDDGASDPETDIDGGKSAMLLATGYLPNTLTVGYKVHQALKRHPLVAERFKYTSADSITPQMIARFFEVERYFVAMASYDTSAEGASASNSFILGNHALLSYSPASPSLMVPSAGYTFAWSNFTAVTGAGWRIKNFRMEQLSSDRIEGEAAYDQKLVASDMGYFFSEAVD